MEIRDFKSCLGLGVAGNFANHLEQAGEIVDFVNVKVDDAKAPKGLFPFYLPENSASFLHTFPLSDTTIKMPVVGGNLQVEPEVALLCDILYDGEKVRDIVPLKFAAYNDCSIRKEGAKKISEKKNWGECSKGVSADFIDLDSFEKGSLLDRFHIASFLQRDGELYAYGEDSPVLGYNYFYSLLREWIVGKMNTQKEEGPLEDIPQILRENGFPGRLLVSIGATSYTPFGESTYLQAGDEIIVAVYDAAHYSQEQLKKLIDSNNNTPDTKKLSLLRQRVVA